MNVLVKEGILGTILLIMGVFDRLYIDWYWMIYALVRPTQCQSMGAEVSIELYRQLLDNGVAVDHCLFDGAPCISLPGFYKKFMYCIFKRILDKVRGKSVNDVLEMPQSDRGARRVSGWHGAIVSEGLQPYGVDRFTTQTGRSLS